MTFAEFKVRVSTYLDVDANRRGIEALRASYMRAALLDLKHFVPCFKDNKYAALYEDTDVTKFTSNEQAAEAVAMFMKSRIARLADKDMQLSDSYRRDYEKLRRQLVRNCTELRLSKAQVDDEGNPILDDQGNPVTTD